MKKLSILSLILLALIVSGCNFPGYEGFSLDDSDDSMATEIAKILTGTPGEIVVSPTSDGGEVEPTNTLPAEETEPPAVDTATPENTATAENTATPEAPTATLTSTEMPSVTPTATLADTDPALTLGEPDWVDTMDDGDNWPKGETDYASIAFESGYMKITSKTAQSGWYLTWPKIENFYLEVKVQSPNATGTDHYGLMFRVPDTHKNDQGYLFGINANGEYSLRLWDQPSMQYLKNWTASSMITPGKDVLNTVGIMAKDGTLTFYINGQKVDEIVDNTYAQGGFGIYVTGINADNMAVWVDQIRYWENP